MDIQIMHDGKVAGTIQEDGFYTEDPKLEESLKRIFDGDGAITLTGGTTTEGNLVDAIMYTKPEEPNFTEALLEDLGSQGYTLEAA